jgi:peptide/nickel transport system permease protein
VTLSVGIIARQSRLVRAGMLEVLHQDYIRTAYAKGLGGATVLRRHALKNALLPVIASLGVDLSFLVGGALVVEQVFAIPGMGRQVFQAINGRDYPVIQATVFVVALWVVAINFLVDAAYGYVDPRVSTEAMH